MDLNMKGKIAIVTGTGSEKGFGRQVSIDLAAEGCFVVSSDINLEGAQATVDAIKAAGGDGVAYQCDVTDKESVNAFVAKVLEEYKQIDILINCAGGCSPSSTFLDKPEEDWMMDMKLNLYSQIYFMKAVIPHMIERKQGHVVNFCGGRGLPFLSTYGAAKGGVEQLTHSIGVEVAKYGVFVNCVTPGLSKTHFVDNMNEGFINGVESGIHQGRLCNAQDVSNVVLFLASDKCSFMNGGNYGLMT